MLTALQIMTMALEIAKAPGFTSQSQQELNSILSDLCETHDFAVARGQYNFTLNPSLITTVDGITNYGGPYPLPLDYLRTSQSSGSEGVQYAFFFVYNGVPYPLRPTDLGLLDMQVQQAGLQNLPARFATDISPESTVNDRIAAVTTASMTNGQTSIVVASASNIIAGMGAAGQGIPPGATVASVVSTTINLAFAAGGPQTVLGTFTASSGTGSASVFFGTQPNLYLWPGPSGSWPARLRYQRKMPPLVDFTRVPWFPSEGYLIDELAARLMAHTGDSRREEFMMTAMRKLAAFDKLKDDSTNRAQTVQLDHARFGTNFSRLKNTKSVGW